MAQDTDVNVVTIREFEQFERHTAEAVVLRERRTEEARVALERLSDAKREAFELRAALQFNEWDKALKLATAETSRRLDLLNHEQARLQADRERFLAKETYEADQKGFREWRDIINSNASIGSGRDKGVAISWSVVLSVVSLGMAAIALFLKFK